jgi:hypothetical protein
MTDLSEQPDPMTPGPAKFYPDYVQSPEEHRRWELAFAIANQLFPEPGCELAAMDAAEAIFHGPWPT